MDRLPETIREMIIFNSIIINKNENGWRKIHSQLINSKTFVKKTNYIFNNNFKFENVIRMPCVCLYDVFSMDDKGNYLDDLCDEIMYW
tara:strand:+ start:1387 stop:1650 length:264 start_codon:yes stop_codon:yes gene_type:complete